MLEECSTPKVEFYYKSKGIFDFAKPSGQRAKRQRKTVTILDPKEFGALLVKTKNKKAHGLIKRKRSDSMP